VIAKHPTPGQDGATDLKTREYLILSESNTKTACWAPAGKNQ